MEGGTGDVRVHGRMSIARLILQAHHIDNLVELA